ncbi:MAG: hypothetical protein M1370_08530 [Bacteroidetes bacterium]|nr:hypothetical protein [Bacteroidota bacterium]MCL5027116.1 hypothetical protein [Chloroflexota bacterium]
MAEKIVKKYRMEIKARLARCPRCGGWVAVEPDPVNGAWKVCVNCGWQQEISLDEVAALRRSR